MLAEKLLERGWVPDALVRHKIRGLLRGRLKQEQGSDPGIFIESLRRGPVAVAVKAANEQHYEVPAAFFERALGPRMKYSCAYFESPNDTLAVAEEQMLALTAKRAELTDGQVVLELGCGWGSLTLWMAEKYPHSSFVGVSNSNSQREFIMKRAQNRGLKNVKIETCDMNDFTTETRFDRVVSIEMFEHMRNVELLLARISGWLKEDGKLFVHIFTHRDFAYLFEDLDESDWMARHFFTGGMMPSHGLYKNFASSLVVEQEWVVPGTHYAATAERWLENMDQNEIEIRKIFSETYGPKAESLWWARWRVFFMSCAELWAYDSGTQWQVSHYQFGKPKS